MPMMGALAWRPPDKRCELDRSLELGLACCCCCCACALGFVLPLVEPSRSLRPLPTRTTIDSGGRSWSTGGGSGGASIWVSQATLVSPPPPPPQTRASKSFICGIQTRLRRVNKEEEKIRGKEEVASRGSFKAFKATSA
ncbi:hypothetical protein C4D60_Mb09t02100 [Musa balbisiana]|uniref:Uncharacterized protein n=1 Tax=Musa balbisiana TaxID=52838 RepID=A0A4S8IDE4_MUSBA|nr:hypothetical protein C4D60_Mb09t02100 [Musa balbisiana]